MNPPGYHWILQPEGDQWRWRVVGRDDGRLLTEGVACTRAEGAAFLARAMSLGVLRQMESVSA